MRECLYDTGRRSRSTTYDRDKESGLDYAMNRIYASTGGRFTSPDKGPHVTHDPATLNRYNYVKSDPINLTDPDGNISPVIQKPPLAYCAPEFGNCGVTESTGTYVREPTPQEKTIERRTIAWGLFMERLTGLKDALNAKTYSDDCNRALGKLSGATMANGQRAGTINIVGVLAQMNATFGQISDGRDTPYWSVFPEGSTDRNQTRNSVRTRNWTVADAMGILGNPAMAQIGGHGVYFNEVFNRTRSNAEVSASLLHEATHNLGFSDTQMNALGAGYNQILQDCIKK